mmetsp:Transcript_20991/g.58099  ORF Transcript_20991/g.58099 Transcript_20991/m.58099 type:complete len:234 (-) Transcript_20991:673-1374(-)
MVVVVVVVRQERMDPRIRRCVTIAIQSINEAIDPRITNNSLTIRINNSNSIINSRNNTHNKDIIKPNNHNIPTHSIRTRDITRRQGAWQPGRVLLDITTTTTTVMAGRLRRQQQQRRPPKPQLQRRLPAQPHQPTTQAQRWSIQHDTQRWWTTRVSLFFVDDCPSRGEEETVAISQHTNNVVTQSIVISLTPSLESAALLCTNKKTSHCSFYYESFFSLSSSFTSHSLANASC